MSPNDLRDWAARLRMAADVLKDVTPDELRVDQPFYDELTLVLSEYHLTDAAFAAAAPNVPDPPDWDQLNAAVHASTPNELLLHVLSWLAQARWLDTPLVRVHAAGLLEPAIRRLADSVSALDITTVKDD
ncbi:hypothetical protein [Asticcacaulis sp. AND118]|uniref:hypothetical protein n=1 Tax=Asticcacaulis sp. AND118 TaxID=2840468 RepID=UPI001CFF9465|nr:hypothetical protein [Asticcacaulis sp. AND118]UDF03010.1 hypothetical protein LH365_11285 [Asticcacaulis sp. AND118]